jgi:8-amino-7-oxononanoate synthase
MPQYTSNHTNNPYDWLGRSLATIQKANWYRSVKNISKPGPIIELDGRSLINFASNDYLGLATDQRLIQAAVKATQEFGTGATGSRLLTGHRLLHRQLEEAIAQLKQTADSLVFSSGYLANLGTISAIVGQRDIIFSDQYNHACLKNGAVLSGAKIIEYPHNDVQTLENLLKNQRSPYRRALIITDSVFSMDGDICPLPAILDLANQYNAMLLIDEAHATGVFGAKGAGCVEYFGLTGATLIQVGTLSKALGSLGGYVAGSQALIDFLRNRASSWIYTTALTPADTAASLTAVNIIQESSSGRSHLWQNVQLLKTLTEDQFEIIGNYQSPIIGVQMRDPAQALAISEKLKELGCLVPAIRPPTVNTSRLRISLMATHTPDQIKQLVTNLHQLLD